MGLTVWLQTLQDAGLPSTHLFVLMNAVTLEELAFGSCQFWHKQGVQVLFDLLGAVFIWDLGRIIQGGLVTGKSYKDL